MNVLASTVELTLGYEALRAQATGQLPASTPRGLALFVTAGFPVWMDAWKPLARPTPTTQVVVHHVEPAGLGGDVVHVLTEMALGCQKRWTA